MSKKITWDSVYADFKSRYPRMRKEVTYWCPKDYVTIELYFKDGSKGTYNFLDQKVKITDETWLHK